VRLDVAQIGVKELKATASSVIEQVEGGAAYIITKRGRPAAVILPVEDAEDLVLANAEEYLRMRREARAAYARGHATRLGDLD
jgi:prevent-host-death family protein